MSPHTFLYLLIYLGVAAGAWGFAKQFIKDKQPGLDPAKAAYYVAAVWPALAICLIIMSILAAGFFVYKTIVNVQRPE